MSYADAEACPAVRRSKALALSLDDTLAKFLVAPLVGADSQGRHDARIRHVGASFPSNHARNQKDPHDRES